MGKCQLLVRMGVILLVGAMGLGPVPAGGQSSRVVALPELETVGDVRAEHGRIYIQDKRDIAVYSFDDGRFLRRIGRTGQGPGEFTMLGGFSVLSDRIVVVDTAKMVMDLKGKILERSFRFPILIDFWLPYLAARRFDVEAGQFVWIEYNDSKERYELHVD